jgi:hypothetical protein
VVDWDRTDRYVRAMRARRYAETNGERDFESLSVAVARALNEVALTKDPARRLALATDVRRVLAAWPGAHYGYRASDVVQLSSLMDDAVAELRAAAGQSRYELDLVAMAKAVPPDEPALPPPTLRESIEQVFSVATMTSDPTERVALLQSILGEVNRVRQEAPQPWVVLLKSKAALELSTELKMEKRYGDLVKRTIASADERTRRADVGGIEGLVKAVLKSDDKLGRRRPQVTASLLATLDGRLDAARRLRLARDAWVIRARTMSDYERRIRASIDRLRRATGSLEQIRQLSGPSPDALRPLAERITDVWRDLKMIRPPAEAAPVHDLLLSACQMAIRAASARQMAISGSNMSTAWEASSAAAGALMLVERAQEELRSLSAPPGL